MHDASNAVVATATTIPASIADGANANVVFSNGTTINVANASGAAYASTDFLTDIVLAANDTMVVSGVSASSVTSTNARPQTYTFSSAAAGSLTLTGADGTTQTLTGLTDLAANETRALDFNQLGITVTLSNGPGTQTIANVIAGLVAAANDSIVVQGTGSQSTLQVGANVPDTLTLDFVSLASDQLGNAAYKLGGSAGLITVNGDQVVKSIQDSHNLMSALDGAIQTLNSLRGTLGAAQNRLEHTINSLGVAVENLTASESRIRDADIAELSSDLVAANILQSAGVSVLAQANQTPQAVLQLLQG